MRLFFAWIVLALPLVGLADSVTPVDAVETYVNIRSAPEAGSEVVGRLNQGKSLPLVASVDGWNEVELEGGGTGYISGAWTTIVADGADDVAAVTGDIAVAPTEPDAEEAVPEPVEPEPESAPEAVADAVEPEPVAEPEPEPAAEPVADEPAPVAAVKAPAVAAAGAVGARGAEGPIGDKGARGDRGPDGRKGPRGDKGPRGEQGPRGERGPEGKEGPTGPSGEAGQGAIKGDPGFIVKFKDEITGDASQIFDNGNQVGIGTTEPKQRLEVNGNIQIHERSSGVAGLMITQSSGETGYIMHNRASTLTIGAGSVDRMTIDRDGNVGIGLERPAHPIHLLSGAHVTAGGVWTNSSSRARKENIEDLTAEEALATLAALQPVQFNYKTETDETYVGFIAEDVPELVANSDRDSLSTMDIVAVLTKVIQEQQRRIEELESRLTGGE